MVDKKDQFQNSCGNSLTCKKLLAGSKTIKHNMKIYIHLLAFAN